MDHILRLHGLEAYALVGGLAFAEAALFVGFVLPGETAVVLGGVLAHQHRVALIAIAATAAIAAVVGDSVGYEVGRTFGSRLLGSSVFDKRQAALQRGQEALRRNGGRAVFFARFTAFLRAVMPGLAGTARMPYRRFLAFNAAGGIVWAFGFTTLGYVAGASYARVEKVAGRASLLLLGAVVLVIVVASVRKHRKERGE